MARELPQPVTVGFLLLVAVAVLEGRGKDVNRQFKFSAGLAMSLLELNAPGVSVWTLLPVAFSDFEFF